MDRMLGRLLIALMVAALIGGVVLEEPAAASEIAMPGNANSAVIVSVDGTVDAGMVATLRRQVAQAEAAEADVLLLEISTLGGFVESALQMRDILIDTPLTTVAFVRNRAWSAGVLITLACDHVVMRSGASLGAAETRPADEKILSAWRAEMEATAKRQDRDPQLAAAMVDQRIAIPGIIDTGALLSLSAEQSEELELIDGIAEDAQSALALLGFSGGEMVNLEPTTLDRFAQLVTAPVVAPIILALGFIGIIVELFMPGFGFPGLLGVASLLAYFLGHVAAGYAPLSIVVLFLVGVGLLTTEVFAAGFGVLGIGGILTMVASIYLASPTPEAATWSLIVAAVTIGVTLLILMRLGSRLPLFRKLTLQADEAKEKGYVGIPNLRSLKGETGTALTPLRPAGTADVGENRVDVVTSGEFIAKGARIRVIEVEGRRVIVKKIDGDE